MSLVLRHRPWQVSAACQIRPCARSAWAWARPASSAWSTKPGGSGGTSTVTRRAPRSVSSLIVLAGRRTLRRTGVKSVHDVSEDDDFWDDEDDEDGPEIIYVRD